MTDMSRERREELEHWCDAADTECPSFVSAPTDELRALLRDSAWRERVERQVIERTADMPTDVIGWSKPDDGSECAWVFRNVGACPGRDVPDLLPDTPGPIYRAIVDTGDEEGA